MPAPSAAVHRLAITHLVVLVVVVLVVVFGAGCTPAPGASDTAPSVVRVVDGDTVVIAFGSHHESVRLIGIDTPEIAHGGEPADCYGNDASERARQLLPEGAPVTVLRDTEPRDIYGRLLAYLIVDTELVNHQLVAEGYARTLSIAPNDALTALLADAERDARRNRLGLWGACSTPK